MGFQLWKYAIHGDATVAREILAMAVIQGGSTILSRLASAADLAYVFEILTGAAMGVLGAVGAVCCCGRNALCSGPADIDEQCYSMSDEPVTPVEVSSEQGSEVTIRLENGHLWPFGRHRCIVTVHPPLAGVEAAGREIWNARGKN